MKKKIVSAVMAASLALSALGGFAAPVMAEETKELSAAIYSYPSDLEPTNGYFGWCLTRIGVGETLMKIDENMETVPWVAESVEQVDDTTWKFVIRDGVTFHNGNVCDAEAVMNSLQRSIDNNERAASISNIDSMSADGLELTVRTKDSYGAFLGYMCEPVFTIVDTSVDTSDYANKPIATGPFMVDEFVPSSNIRVVKYDGYRDGAANVDAINFPFILDSGSRVMALQSGEIQVAQEIATVDLGPFVDNADYTILSRPGLKTDFCYMNLENEFLQDKAVRLAIAYGIDRELYSMQFLGGQAATSLFSPTLGFGNDDLADYAYTYDPEKAAQILDEAGYTDTDGDGIREMNGKNISLELAVVGGEDSALNKTVGEAMSAQLKEVGIEITLMVSELLSQTDVQESYNLMFKHVFAGNTNDPQNFLDLYFSSEGSNNIGHYHNEEFDALVESLKTEFDREKRIEIATEAQKLVLEDCGYLFLCYPDYNIVTGSNITGIKHYPVNFYFLDKDIDIVE